MIIKKLDYACIILLIMSGIRICHFAIVLFLGHIFGYIFMKNGFIVVNGKAVVFIQRAPKKKMKI